MILTRGKHKGAHATVRSFCNDWITFDTDDGKHGSTNVLGVQLDVEEVAEFRAATNVGMMWHDFDLSDVGWFTRKAIVGICSVCGMWIKLNQAGLLTKHGGGILPGVVQANRLLGLPPMQDARTGPCTGSWTIPAQAKRVTL